MDKFLGLMGYDSNADIHQIQSALAELGQSMDQLHTKIDGLVTQMDTLTNAVYDATGKEMWNTFRTNDGMLRTVHLPKVESLFDLMFFWNENNPPSQYLLERYVSDVAEALIAVRTFVTGSQGTLTQLLESLEYTAEVNDLEAYWAFVDEYRAEWRAVLAQALVALEYVNQLDPSGYTQSSGYTQYRLESSRQVAHQAVESMWAAGLSIPQD